MLNRFEDIYEYKICNDGYILRKKKKDITIGNLNHVSLRPILEKNDITKDNFTEFFINLKLMAQGLDDLREKL